MDERGARPMTWENLPGWFDWAWLYERWARDCRQGGTFVEVGVYLGRSFAFMDEELRKHGKEVDMWAIDNWAVDQRRGDLPGPHWWGWGGENWPGMPDKSPRHEVAERGGPFNAFASYMHEHAREALERAYVLRMPSARAARVFDDHSVDLVYIDADHGYDAVLADIRAWAPKVRGDGIIAGHDFQESGVSRAVSEVFDGKAIIHGATWMVQP
jgi:Methyltransferase domain